MSWNQELAVGGRRVDRTTFRHVTRECVLAFIRSILAVIRVFFRTRSDTALEVLALRQQLAVLQPKRHRPALNSLDRLFWTTLRGLWPRWTDVLRIVKPATVIAWHRSGFRLYWRWRSRPRGGRPKITEEIRVLIRRLADENPDCGAPKIHGELQKLGFVVSERVWHGIGDACGGVAIRVSGGWLFSRITAK